MGGGTGNRDECGGGTDLVRGATVVGLGQRCRAGGGGAEAGGEADDESGESAHRDRDPVRVRGIDESFPADGGQRPTPERGGQRHRGVGDAQPDRGGRGGHRDRSTRHGSGERLRRGDEQQRGAGDGGEPGRIDLDGRRARRTVLVPPSHGEADPAPTAPPRAIVSSW